MADPPQGPIFVLGKDDSFLNVANRVDEALRHRHHDEEMGDPPPAHVEFFDVRGRKYRLELVEDEGGDHRRAVRQRVGAMLRRLKADVLQADPQYPNAAWFDTIDGMSDYEEFAHEAVKIFDDEALPAPGKSPPQSWRPRHTADWWHNARHRMGWTHP